ncbi:sialate O-acetylesterase [Flavobacterium daejeonense]|uniref:sialate O-acetylesterase n=1 Tax=Flavobacterium daejeonense TaxID=350893 RepID=UPI001B807F48|nr:sialate O-acetylesterase [Flavobacterium daejeonense]
MRIVLELMICLLLNIGTFYGQKVNSNNTLDLYLLIGQSNMAGRGVIDDESQHTSENILTLDKTGNWVVAKDPLHFDKPYAGVGPGLSFAQAMLEDQGKIKIGLIPCAWGGSPIKVWSSGAKYFENFPYDEAIARAKIAMQKGQLKGILWHQGESDNDASRSVVYFEKLKELIANFRKDLNAPNLPFIAGEIGRFNQADYINKIVNTLPTEVENTAVVSSEGLVDKGDQLHFDSASARELGKRYAEAMKKILKEASSATSKKRPKIVLTFDDAEITHYRNVAPLLKKYGFNATFFVCEFPIKKSGQENEYMTWKQIKELHQQGFEIGNHTGHHKNLTKLSPDDMKKEIAYIDEKCQAFGIPKPVSLAYPGNRNDSISQRIVKEMGYKYARAGGAKNYNPKTDNPFAIPSFTVIDSEKYKARTLNGLKNIQNDEILVLTFHGVPDVLDPDYSTSIELLDEIFAFIKEKKYKVVAMRDL